MTGRKPIFALVCGILAGCSTSGGRFSNSDFATITVGQVDDRLTCVLNGSKTIIDHNFSSSVETVDFLKDLRRGPNKLRCTATDINTGNVFAFSYQVNAKIGMSKVSHKASESCYFGSCARKSNTVYVDDILINNYRDSSLR